MANFHSAVKIDVSWTTLKQFSSTKNLSIQYDSSAAQYDIFCLDGNIVYYALIFRGSVPDTTRFSQTQNDLDKADFETSYKDIVTNRVTTPSATYDGYAITTANPTLIAGSDGSFIRTLKADTTGHLVVVGQGVAGTPAGGVSSIQGVAGGTAVPISGTVTAINASVSTTGTAPPASATYIGGSVTTAAPAYTTGQMNALSLTTTGLLRIDGSGVTQPVSGTVTANIGTSGSLALDATLTGGTQTTRITDGTNTATVKAASTAAVATDKALVVAISPNNSVAVTGTVTANIGTTNGLALDTSVNGILVSQGSTTSGEKGPLIQGAVTTASPTYTTAQTSPLSLTTAGALRIDGSAVTQPVSGTITANAGSGNFSVVQATAANLNATITGTVTANIGTSGSLALDTSVNGILVSQGSTTSGEKGPLIQGAVTTAAPTYTTAQTSPLSLTTTGLLRVDGSGVTQPVSGTVTANIGTTNGLALDATLTGGTQRTKITDGTNNAAVKAASTAAVATDPALVVAISPNNTVTVTGTVTATNPSVSTTGAAPPASATYIGGSVTTAAPAYTTGQMNALSLTTTGLLRIDGSGVTQPVSGTVTANIGTTNGLALDATLAKLTIAQSAALSTNTQALMGGSVTTVSPTYTTGNINPLSLTTAGALRTDSSGVTQPVSGTITANIGTTNGLALDTSVNGIVVTQGSTTSGEKGPLIQGAVTTAAPTYTTAQTSPLSLTTAGALRTDSSATTQPVSGTVTANAGTGNFTVVQATAANLRAQTASESATAAATPGTAGLAGGAVTTAAPAYTTGQMNALSLTTTGLLRIDGSGVTQPVSGTVTANIGTTNGLALDATLAKLTIAQGTALGANTQAMVGGSVTTAAPTYTTGQISPLSLTTAGALRIDGSGVTQPVSGTVTANQGGAPWSQNVTQFGGVAISTGTGASGTGIPRVTVANDSNILATQSGTWTVQPGNTANTTPWLATINQGGNSAAVKAASTAAVATDPALVVAISPNNTISVGPVTVSQTDVTGTANLNALNTTATVALAGTTSAAMQLLAGTLIGTIVPEVSVDGGTTWVAAFFDDPATGNKVASIVFAGSNAATTRTIVATGGSSNVRVRVSAFTSGAATCNMRATTQNDPTVFFDGSAGSALPPTMAQSGGSVTTAAPTYTTGTLNALSLTTAGALRTDSSTTTQPVSGTVTSNQGTANTLANAWSTKITDATNGPVAVKAASTAAVAADPALVVSISPNSVVNPDVTATGALGALNAAVQVNCSGLQTVGIQLAAGTLAGTIIPEFSWDGGTTWSPGYFIGPASLGAVASLVLTNPNTAAGKMVAVIGGAGLVRVRVSAYTSGTANITLRASEIIAEFVGLSGAQNGAVLPPMVLQVGGSDGTDLRALSTSNTGVLNVSETDQLATSSYPDPSSIISGTATPTIDAFGNLETRGTVLTDEGSFRDDFTGSGLTTTLTGTITFTAASTSLTGAGTTFTTQVIAGQWIKKSADAETLYAQVATVISDTQITLTTAYAGTSTATTAVVSNWKTVTATGGTITVATSSVSLTSGTTSGQQSSIQRLGDFLPYTFQINLSVSQRIANQTIIVGFMDTFSATPIKQATIQFSGTTNTTLNFVTSFGSAAADTQTTAVTIPNAGTSATSHTYKIDLSGTQACLSIDGILVATNATHIPGPYDNINIFAGTLNTGTAGSSTTLAIDFVYFLNADRLQIDNDFRGEPLPVTGKLQPVYGTNNQAVTITLASLTTGSARASTAISNTTNLYEDVLIFVKITTAAAATSTTGYVNVYGYGSVDGGTTYPEAITGTDAAVTLTTPPNLVILAQINANTNAATKTYGPFSFCRQYGVDRLPTNWGVVVVNQTGATLNATAGNHAVLYQGVNGQLV